MQRMSVIAQRELMQLQRQQALQLLRCSSADSLIPTLGLP